MLCDSWQGNITQAERKVENKIDQVLEYIRLRHPEFWIRMSDRIRAGGRGRRVRELISLLQQASIIAHHVFFILFLFYLSSASFSLSHSLFFSLTFSHSLISSILIRHHLATLMFLALEKRLKCGSFAKYWLEFDSAKKKLNNATQLATATVGNRSPAKRLQWCDIAELIAGQCHLVFSTQWVKNNAMLSPSN